MSVVGVLGKRAKKKSLEREGHNQGEIHLLNMQPDILS